MSGVTAWLERRPHRKVFWRNLNPYTRGELYELLMERNPNWPPHLRKAYLMHIKRTGFLKRGARRFRNKYRKHRLSRLYGGRRKRPRRY